MPYRWTHTADGDALTLWPHQSLTPRGYAWFLGTTAAMLAIPLVAVLGSPVVWVLLATFGLAFAGAWHAIERNRRDRALREDLEIGPDLVTASHRRPRRAPLVWRADPHWVTIHLRNDGPVENYLTLRGGGREIEIGSFLTPEERVALFDELGRLLTEVKTGRSRD